MPAANRISSSRTRLPPKVSPTPALILRNADRLMVMHRSRSSGVPPITADAQVDRMTESEPQTG